MRRDLELIRDLLFFFECRLDRGAVRASGIDIPNRSDSEIADHLILMYQAGFLDAEIQCSKSNPERIFEVIPFVLSWKGHEFLDTIRDDEIWRQTKIGAKKIGAFSYEVLRDVAKTIIAKKLKNLTGGAFEL